MDEIDDLLNLQRKFQSLSVNLFPFDYQKAVKLFPDVSSRFGTQIRSLTFNECEFVLGEHFCGLVKNLPLLEELEVVRSKFHQVIEARLDKLQPVALKKLKTLKFDKSSWALFQCLVGTQVKHLKIAPAILSFNERPYLINFLQACHGLDSIEVIPPAFTRIFETDFRNKMSFKLRSFKCIQVSPFEEQEASENFSDFIASHSATLTELQLNYLTPALLKTILTKLKVLQKLRINSTSLPVDKEFYDQFLTIKSLTKLTLHDEISDEEAAKGILKICSNLEVLKAIHDAKGVISKLIPFLALHNQSLKALHVETLKLSKESIFDAIEFLHIENIDDLDSLVKFTMSNPTIETLSFCRIEEEMQPIEEVVKKLLEVESLQHLKFTGSFKCAKEIFKHLKVYYKKLKSLEMDVIYDKGAKNLLFNLPEDPSRWDSRCEFFDLIQ